LRGTPERATSRRFVALMFAARLGGHASARVTLGANAFL
jgi:hypothetical protein